MDHPPRVAFNTFVQVAGRGVVIFFSLLTASVLTRALGQQGYGAFGLISSAAIIFYSISDWGTNLITVREVSQNSQAGPALVGQAFFLRTFFALLASFLFALFCLFNPFFKTFRLQALLGVFIIFLLSLKTTANIAFQARLKLQLVILSEIIATFLFWLFLRFLPSITIDSSLKLLIFTTLVSLIVILPFSFREIFPQFHFSPQLVKKLFREAFPLGLLMIVYSVYNRIDSFLLQALKGEGDTGIYLLAYKVHDNLVLGAAYLMNALFPVIASLKSTASSKEQINALLQKAFGLLLVVSFPLVVIVLIFAPTIVNILGGEDFSASVPVLRILSFATAFSYLNHLAGYSLLALNHQKASLYFGLLGCFVNVSLNFFLIPRFSFLGAAFVTVITEGFIFLLSLNYLTHRLKFRFSLSSFPKTIKEILISKGRFF